MKNDELLHKWINNTITAEELEIFKNRDEFDSLTKLYRHTENLEIEKPDFNNMLDDILKEKSSNQAPSKKSENRTLFRNLLRFGIAASVLILVSIMFWPSDTLTTFKTDGNYYTADYFPDESRFILNGNGNLSYNKKEWDEQREVNLDGEAYFIVLEGASFKVVTENGVVEVMGTSFNVKSRLDMIEVFCDEGKVSVNYNGLTELIEANQGVKFNKGRQVDRWIDSEGNNYYWTKDYSKLRRANLEEVIAELEMKFEINIDRSGVSSYDLVNCSFKYENLDYALKSSLTPFKISYTIVDEKNVKLRNY